MKAIAVVTVYEDGSVSTINKDARIDTHPGTGEQSVNGEPLSALSETAQMILGLSAHPTNTAVDNNTVGNVVSKTVAMNLGGETQIGNVGIGSRKTRMTDCAVGKTDLNLGEFPMGAHVSITVAALNGGTVSATAQAVDRTGAAVTAPIHGTDPTLAFTVTTGEDIVVHCDFASAPPDVLVDVQAH